MKLLAALLCDAVTVADHRRFTLHRLFVDLRLPDVPRKGNIGFYFEFELEPDEFGRICDRHAELVTPDGTAVELLRGSGPLPDRIHDGEEVVWTFCGTSPVLINDFGPHAVRVYLNGAVIAERSLPVVPADE